MPEHTHHRSEDTDAIKVKLTIREEVKMALDDHEENCMGKNDMRYMRSPRAWVQVFAIFGLLVVVAGGVAGYWQLEGKQNERDTIMEFNGVQREMKIQRLEESVIKMNAKIDDLPKAVVDEIRKRKL
jgi:hypothetical protein